MTKTYPVYRCPQCFAVGIAPQCVTCQHITVRLTSHAASRYLLEGHAAFSDMTAVVDAHNGILRYVHRPTELMRRLEEVRQQDHATLTATELGRRGGKAGKGKRSADCQRAARIRWDRVRATTAKT